MKKLITILFLMVTAFSFGQVNQIDVKKAYIRNWIIYKGDTLAISRVSVDTLFVTKGSILDTLIAGGPNYWYLQGDTAKTLYHVKIDSSFLMKYGNWYNGYWSPADGGDPLDRNYDTLILFGYANGDQTKSAMIYAGSNQSSFYRLYLQSLSHDSSSVIDMGHSGMSLTAYNDALGSSYINIYPDTLKISSLYYKFYPLPDEATRIGRIQVIQTDGKVEWCSPRQLGDTIAVNGGGPWTQDATSIHVSDTTDRVIIGKATGHPLALLQVDGNIDVTHGNVYKIGNHRALNYNGDTYNTFVGESGMQPTLSGTLLTGCGSSALLNNTTGETNSAFGGFSMYSNQDGSSNSAFGTNALKFNVSGNINCAFGHDNSSYNEGSGNASFGFDGMWISTSADSNCAIGTYALMNNDTGDNNTALGTNAGKNSQGNNNLYLGFNAGKWNTGSFKGYIDVDDKGSEANDSTQSLLFMNFVSNKLRLNGYLDLPATTSTAGQITQDGNSILHTYNDGGGLNIFIGGSGNFTLTGNSNIGIGDSTLRALTSGDKNVTIGYRAGRNGSNTLIGATFIGYEAGLMNNSTQNVAVGYNSLKNNTSGQNVAVGYGTLEGAVGQSAGGQNTAIGDQAMRSHTTGTLNVAIGGSSMYWNTSGGGNTALGSNSLLLNKGNNNSTAIGYGAMQNADNTSSGRTTYNTAVGYEAMKGSGTAANNTGQNNTAVGYQALDAMTSADSNVAIGVDALGANTTGGNNIAIGYGAGSANTTGNNQVWLGNTNITNTQLYGNGNITGEWTTNNSYGELWDNAGTVIATVATPYRTITSLQAGDYNQVTLGDSSMTILQAGTYLVNVSASFTHSVNNTVVHFSVFKNATHDDSLEAERKISVAGDHGSASISGLITVAANDVMKVRAISDNSGNTTFNHINFTMTRIK